jgi:hypothetical protein
MCNGGGLAQPNCIDADVSHGVGIDEAVGQQAVILVGTEQALRRTDDGFGEAGVVLRVHGCVPWG